MRTYQVDGYQNHLKANKDEKDKGKKQQQQHHAAVGMSGCSGTESAMRSFLQSEVLLRSEWQGMHVCEIVLSGEKRAYG